MNKHTSGLNAGNAVINSFRNNLMVIFFIILAIFLALSSGNSLGSMGRDISARFFRNILLIVALILPIMAGVGLNFGIVLGAMSAQLALVILLALDLGNAPMSLPLWMLLTVIISIFNGYLLAILFNKTKGREMIVGLLVGFFANGLYMLILMVIIGGIIILDDPLLVVSAGTPIKNTLNLPDALYGAMDNAVKLAYYYFIIGFFALSVLLLIIKLFIDLKTAISKKTVITKTVIATVIVTTVFVFCLANTTVSSMLKTTRIPFVTGLVCVVVMLLVRRIMRSKMGHDFVSVRNDIQISASVGINVDKARTAAIILSTVIAGIGQVVYIQNLGVLNTYVTHMSIATYAIAAILIGGATIKKASLANAAIGCFLFQIIYGVAPNAAKNLIGNTQIGEYFRVFLCYGLIALAIVSYAIKEHNAVYRKMNQSE
jgi:simple sugar transport system permease protein